MGEMIMVLVVVFIVGLTVLVWYTRSGQAETERVLTDDASIALAQTARAIADLPEIRYSLAGREDAMVIDWKRARAFAQTVNEPENQGGGRGVYRERFNGYTAEIRCIAPCDDEIVGSLTLFNYIDAEAAQRSSVPFVVPILLYEPISRSASFGMITLTQVNE